MEIPLKINLFILNKKFKLFPSIGCSSNLFLGKKTNTTFSYDDGHTEKRTSHSFNSKYIPSVDLALLIGIGLSYDLNENFYIKLEPSYRQFIRPLVDPPISGYFYSIGINTGLYYRF